MDMRIEVTCKETIKPSSPTPNHLRTHKFTILDQFAFVATNLHVPLLLFYTTNTSQNSTETSNNLKKSLRETLTRFYPLAGQVKDSCIDCNDAGATYIETRVAGDMEDVLKEPKFEKLKQLLPINPNENFVRFTVPDILFIQINHFNCGGVAIGVCISHVIADASTVGTFVKSWAAIARGGGVEVNGVVTDCTSLFPPFDYQTFSFLSQTDFIDKDVLLKGVVSNRFVFDGDKIAALRRKIGSASCSDLPTRFEALSALILGVLMSITEEKSSDHVSCIAVDLRSRMNPPLPQHSIGNIWQFTQLMCLNNENGVDYNDLAQKIRYSVRGMNDENVRSFHETKGMMNFLPTLTEEIWNRQAIGIASFSSWCKYPFYEVDFGCGRPIWVTTVGGHNRVAYFLDSRDGKGVEVWLGLHSEVMSQFEKHRDIIEYASFITTK